MTNEIVFTLKIKGTFTRDGFIINDSSPLLTVKKFNDGTFSAKIGHKYDKRLFKCLNQFGINL